MLNVLQLVASEQKNTAARLRSWRVSIIRKRATEGMGVLEYLERVVANSAYPAYVPSLYLLAKAIDGQTGDPRFWSPRWDQKFLGPFFQHYLLIIFERRVVTNSKRWSFDLLLAPSGLGSPR